MSYIRSSAALVVTAIALHATSATGQAAAPAGDAAQDAYVVAMRCFVANGKAGGDRQRQGDATGAARYEQQAQRSFDAAVRLGRGLSLSNARINGDLDTVSDRELPLMVSDVAYFHRAVAVCRTYGLM